LVPVAYFSRKHRERSTTSQTMFLSVATISHFERDDELKRFYAKAELTLSEDLDHAELQLPDVVHSVHTIVLMNAKAGKNTFNISGKGDSPFAVGDPVRVTCFLKAKYRPCANPTENEL
jgi:hypothetical protein